MGYENEPGNVRILVNFNRESFQESNLPANSLTIDRSGTVLAVGYEDSNIRLFNVKNLRMDTIYKGHEDAVLELMFDPNNKSLISTSADKTFRIWQ